ncbi:MAG: hypothetical protein AAGJ34_00490 [Pseudomonadota bacterium]
MKKLAYFATAAVAASAAVAGGLDEPVVEAVEVVENDSGIAAWLIPLAAIALVALAVSGSDDDDDDDS